jgi:hypothetical protein
METIAPPNSGPTMRLITGGTVNQSMAERISAGGTARSLYLRRASRAK